MQDGVVRYIFQLEDRELVFDVGTQAQALDSSAEYPDWARLEHCQCACCPLKSTDCKYCPVAMKMHELLAAFADNQSTERVRVLVKTAQREYAQTCDLQVGINSLLGLMMATSGCPVLAELGAMASFHIPFCTTRETLHRTVGSYLTKQYFVQSAGGDPDWELQQLKALYKVLEGLNQDFSKRVQSSIRRDAVANAVIMFFATSVVVASSLEQQLQRHQGFLTNQHSPALGTD